MLVHFLFFFLIEDSIASFYKRTWRYLQVQEEQYSRRLGTNPFRYIKEHIVKQHPLLL